MNEAAVAKQHPIRMPRVFLAGRTKCCFTNHYLLNEGSAICTNSACTNYLGATEVMRRHRMKRLLTGAWLFLFLAVFTFDDYSNPETSQFSVLKRIEVPLTPENLSKELNRIKILCPKEVFAQMMLESGNLKSNILNRTNNMLGMRYPFRRKTMASGIYLPSKDTIIYGNASTLKKYASLNQYAVYDTWQDAVKDYKIWQDQHFSLNERYLLFLGNVYAEDSSYVKKIRQVMSSR